MCIRYQCHGNVRETVLNVEDSGFSADEIVKQFSQALHSNQGIHTVIIENMEFEEHGMTALCHAVLGHRSLRHLSLLGVRCASYLKTTGDEYYFPLDLDKVVENLCAILRDGKLYSLQIKDLEFIDRTQRTYEHFDMVDPATMRDLLLQEKQPFYIKEMTEALEHNPYLKSIEISIVDTDMKKVLQEIRWTIEHRLASEQINKVFQGTHAAM